MIFQRVTRILANLQSEYYYWINSILFVNRRQLQHSTFVSFVRYNVVFPTTVTTKALTPLTDPIKEPKTNPKTENVNVFEVSGGTKRRRLNDQGLFLNFLY